MRYLQIFLIFFLCSFFSFGQQSRIDSLKNELKKTEKIIEKIKLCNELINEIWAHNSFHSVDSITLKEINNVARKGNDKGLEAKSYMLFTSLYMSNENFLKSKKNIEKALLTNDSIQNVELHYKIKNLQGRMYHYFEKENLAINSYKSVINQYMENPKGKIIFDLYSNIAISYGAIKKINKQTESLLEAIKYTDIFNDIENKAYSLYNLAWTYMSVKNYNKSILYFKKGIELINKEGIKKYTYFHHGIGLAYSRWGKYKQALEHNFIALSFFRKTKNIRYEFDTLNNIAVVYNRMGNPSNGAKYASQALNIAYKMNHSGAINSAKYTLAVSQRDLKNYIKAEQSFLELSRDTLNIRKEDTEYKSELFLNFSHIYYAKENYKKAYSFLKKHKTLSDSINKEIRESNFSELERKYQSEKKEKENLKLKAENAEQALIVQKANTQKWFLILGLLLITIIACFIWLRYKSETKAKAVISKQKDNIENLQKELHHRVKNNLSVIDTFIEVAKEEFNDKKFDKKLTEIQNRISSINEIHKQLYLNRDITSLSIKKYIDVLAKNVAQSFKNKNITINNKIENIRLKADTSFPVGLIINEFLTNSFKYAFNEEKGEINIGLKEENSIYLLSLSDNGKGFSKGFNIEETQTFGLRIMKLLTKQVNGEFDLKNNNGVQLNIKIPKV